jgi:hypothetical protein
VKSLEPALEVSCPLCGTEGGAETEAEVEAEACSHCGMCREDLPAAGFVRRRLAGKELALRAALVGERFEELPRRDRGRLRAQTLLLLGLLLVCIAGGAACFAVSEVPRIYWKMVAVLGAVVFLAFKAFLRQDLKVPGPTGRVSPTAGLRAFLYAMITGSYRYAHGCLVPGERDERTRRQPQFEDLGALGRHYEFNRLDAFRRYWHALVSPSNRAVTQPSYVNAAGFRVLEQRDDFALVCCHLDVLLWDRHITEKDYPLLKWAGAVKFLLNLCIPRRRRLHLRKLLRRIDGQWYLVNGELASLEDFALEEAAAISEMSNQELIVLANAGAEESS